jgi:hypothetical protein
MKNEIEIRPHEIVAIKVTENMRKETSIVYTWKGIQALIKLGWKAPVIDKIKMTPVAWDYYNAVRHKIAPLILLLLLCVSCVDNDPLPKKRHYTFDVRAKDGGNYSAAISWGIDSLRFQEWMEHRAGFATCFDIGPGEEFYLRIDNVKEPVKLYLFWNKESGEDIRSVHDLQPGALYQLNLYDL